MVKNDKKSAKQKYLFSSSNATMVASKRKAALSQQKHSQQLKNMEAELIKINALIANYTSILKTRVFVLHILFVFIQLVGALGLFAALAILIGYLWPSIRDSLKNNNVINTIKDDIKKYNTSKASVPVEGKDSIPVVFDQNQDGQITIDELRAYFESKGLRLSDEEIKRIFTNANTDNKNNISIDEFNKLLEEIKKLSDETDQNLLPKELPTWAIVLIVFAAIGMSCIVIYFAWKKSWLIVLITIFVVGITISIVENQLFKQLIVGGWITFLSGLLLLIYFILRTIKTKFIDPVVEKINLSIEKAKELAGKISSTTKDLKDKISGAIMEKVQNTQKIATNAIASGIDIADKTAQIPGQIPAAVDVVVGFKGPQVQGAPEVPKSDKENVQNLATQGAENKSLQNTALGDPALGNLHQYATPFNPHDMMR